MARLLCVILALAAAAPAWAGQLPDATRRQLQEYANTRDRDDLLDLTGTDALSVFIVQRTLESRRLRVDVADVRQDLQGGSLTPRTGGTSVLARPGISDLVGAALESGAIGRKSDDKSVSFSVNALPLRQLLSLEVPRGCGSEDAACLSGSGRWLRGLSGGISLSPSTAATPITTGTGVPELEGFRIGGRTLQSASLRYELFVRERDAGKVQAEFAAAAKALQARATSFANAELAFETALETALTALKWRDETLRLLEEQNYSFEELEAILLRRYEGAYELMRDNAELRGAFAASAPEMLAYRSAQNALLAEKLYRKAATLDYVYERPADHPPLHQARLVLATPLGRKAAARALAVASTATAPTGMLTVNAGVSIFDGRELEAGEWKVRDAQFSAGVDWSPRTRTEFRPTYTAAYYFQYMVSNGVLKFTGDAVTPGGAAIPLPKAAKEILNTKGAIHIAQVRASFPVAKGVSVPLALSYANRSELIVGRAFWQGHLGVSYDFSQLRKAATNR